MEQQSPRAHLSPIIRGINRTAVKVKDQKDQIMEMFNGVLTRYYSSEVCHNLRGKEYSSIHQMTDKMEAAWETRSPMECARMHRTSADSTAHPRRHQWSRQQDQTSSERAGGYPDKSKGGSWPAGLSRGGGGRGWQKGCLVG